MSRFGEQAAKMSDDPKDSREALPRGLERVPLPPKFHEVRRQLTTHILREAVLWRTRTGIDQETVEILPGFDDVLGEPLGQGYFYNQPGSIFQLIFALAISGNSAVSALTKKRDKRSPEERIAKLRDAQALAG